MANKKFNTTQKDSVFRSCFGNLSQYHEVHVDLQRGLTIWQGMVPRLKTAVGGG